jgi:DNA primase
MTLLRYPDGVEKQPFYEKQAPPQAAVGEDLPHR